jgi:type I site-specific restriction endonuclease
MKALTESDTRAQFIDPALVQSGWEGHLVRREFQITAGRIIVGGLQLRITYWNIGVSA